MEQSFFPVSPSWRTAEKSTYLAILPLSSWGKGLKNISAPLSTLRSELGSWSMATHFHWPHLMVSQVQCKGCWTAQLQKEWSPWSSSAFTGWPLCLHNHLQLFLFCHTYAHIWAYKFFFLCKRKQNASFPPLVSAISKRQIRWRMMERHCTTFPVLWLFFSPLLSAPSAHIQRRGKTRPNLLPPCPGWWNYKGFYSLL